VTRTARQPKQPRTRNQPLQANRLDRSGSDTRAQPWHRPEQTSTVPDTTTWIAVISALLTAATRTWSATWRFAIACAALALPIAVALTAYLLVK
jgi:hypothetical protein